MSKPRRPDSLALERPLPPRQARFVSEYLIDLNQTRAAIRAGYSPHTAAMQACRLLKKVKILTLVSKAKAAQLGRADLTAARVLEELRRLAFSDARLFWNADGTLKEMAHLTEEQGAALAGFEAIKKNAVAGDGHTDTVHKIKLWDKCKALDTLAKHFGLLTEKVEHSGGIEFTWKRSESE